MMQFIKRMSVGERMSFGQRMYSGERTSSVESRVIQVRAVKNMTRNGKVLSYSALVVSGDGKGSLGMALSKDTAMSDAVAKASRLSIRNMESFELFEGRTLFHSARSKYKATKLFVTSAPPEYGKRCNWVLQEMSRCAGIRDIVGKVLGSRHPINVCRAFMEVMRRQKSPRQVALDSGMSVVDVVKIFEYSASKATKQNAFN